MERDSTDSFMIHINNKRNQRRKRALERRTIDMEFYLKAAKNHKEGSKEHKELMRKNKIAMTDVTNLRVDIIG